MVLTEKLRFYGKAPFNVVVLHGGPGAPGEMAPVAREISKKHGVLEPLFSAYSIDEQLKELENIIRENASNPVILIGWSWGAMLGFIFAAQFPALVKKLILVSSGSFEDKYANEIQNKRLSRCNEKEKLLYQDLLDKLTTSEHKTEIFKQLGSLISKMDSYDLVEYQDESLECQYDLYQSIWAEAKELRRCGKLLAFGKDINCPVVAIHGDCDPRPIEGITKPLSPILKSFRYILLEKCGHHPWFEKHAKDAFYGTIHNELAIL